MWLNGAEQNDQLAIVEVVQQMNLSRAYDCLSYDLLIAKKWQHVTHTCKKMNRKTGGFLGLHDISIYYLTVVSKTRQY